LRLTNSAGNARSASGEGASLEEAEAEAEGGEVEAAPFPAAAGAPRDSSVTASMDNTGASPGLGTSLEKFISQSVSMSFRDLDGIMDTAMTLGRPGHMFKAYVAELRQS